MNSVCCNYQQSATSCCAHKTKPCIGVSCDLCGATTWTEEGY